MYIVESYPIAILFTLITMVCWGSWANTQKLTSKSWRFELFYWDYVIGILLFSAIFGLTLGSTGTAGRSFIADIQQADLQNIGNAVLGGIIFNASNILLVAAMAIAGMAVAFPVGVGIALVFGVLVNYVNDPKGKVLLLFVGVGLVVIAILLDAIAFKKMSKTNNKVSSKGIILLPNPCLLISQFPKQGNFHPTQPYSFLPLVCL